MHPQDPSIYVEVLRFDGERQRRTFRNANQASSWIARKSLAASRAADWLTVTRHENDGTELDATESVKDALRVAATAAHRSQTLHLKALAAAVKIALEAAWSARR